MADVGLVSVARVEVVESTVQMTLPAGAAITPGQPVRVDSTTGRFVPADAVSVANADAYGIAVGQHIVPIGMPITAIRIGVVDGYNFTQAYNAPVFVSVTVGAVADAAPTVAGQGTKRIGRVIPATATTLGTAYDKLLSIEL